ncbi:hypothetical protein F5Y14DRAFT_258786 [Nemania sp. NC0429]|nr:hypothetical protein F5Y14DRAFT_258786 [Nemania sp. NC0429]
MCSSPEQNGNSPCPLPVIIIGGGPVGLVAAHALFKARIDFLVLERRATIVEDVGASIVVHPGSLRVLSQLGLLGRLREESLDLDTVQVRGLSDRRSYGTISLGQTKKEFGSYSRVIHRAHLLKILYHSLTDEMQSRISTGKTVIKIQSNETCVDVSCVDGNTYHGSIVIGADGVNSIARKTIHNLTADINCLLSAQAQSEHPFVATYRVLWFSAPRPTSFPPGQGTISHGKGVSIQTVSGSDILWVFLYERLERPVKTKAIYSADDLHTFLGEWSHLMVNDQVALGDIFITRYRAGLTNVDEGIARNWSHGRIVLAGDAAHKLTPNAGLGFNNGVQDVTVLVNELYRLFGAQGNADLLDLTRGFERYYKTRLEALNKDLRTSALSIRFSTWENIGYRIFDRYLLRFSPSLQRFLITYGNKDRIRAGRILTFIRSKEPFHGDIPWEFPSQSPE